MGSHFLFRKDGDNIVLCKSFKVEGFRGMQNSTVIHWKNFVVSHQSCIAKLVSRGQTATRAATFSTGPLSLAV